MLLLIGIAILASVLPGLWLINSRVPAPQSLGATDGRLATCPESPNCVSSQSDSVVSRIEPLPFSESPDAALARLSWVIAQLPRTRLVKSTDVYRHYEFRSLVCRFVDDVEFLADGQAKVIHVRSASRMGYSDLGANRRRVEAIRAAWGSKGPLPSPPS